MSNMAAYEGGLVGPPFTDEPEQPATADAAGRGDATRPDPAVIERAIAAATERRQG